MPHRNYRVLVIAQDVRIVAVMLEASGFITEGIGLRQIGPNAELHDLSDGQLAEIEHFLGAADIRYYAEPLGKSMKNPPHGRHAGP